MNISNPFKKKLFSGLRSQLILGIGSIIVVIISLFVADLTSRQKAFFLKLNHDRGVGLSENLANIATSHVAANELDGLQSLLSTYRKIPGLEYAMVTSSDGIVLAHTNESYLGLRPADSISAKLKPVNATQVLLENNYIFDVTSPIINNNEIVGWARIGLSQTYLTANLSEIKKRGILYIFISLIVGSLLAVLVAGRLSKGLQKLVIVAQKIKEGNKDLRAEPSKSIEVTQLGIAFNQMLDEISANERLLSKVLENMPVGVFILDAQGKVVTANPAGQDMWKGVKYVGVDDYNQYKAWFIETGKEVQNHEWGAAIVLAEGRPVFDQEIEIECFDKSRKIILNSAIPLRDENEKITGVITINIDITERKKAENELRKKNHEVGERIKELKCLYRMSELSNDPNKTMHDILQDCVNIIPPSYQFPEIACARIEFQDRIFESMGFAGSIWKQEQNIISNGVVMGKVQVYYKKQMPDETEGPFLSEERLLINSIADILGSSADRKRIEKELIEREEQLKLFIEHSPASLAMFDTEMRYIATSRRWMNDYNLSDQNIIGKTHYEIFPEIGQEWKDIHQRCLQGAIERREEDSFTRLDGSTDWLKWEIRPWHNANDKIGGIIMFTEVITDRKITEIKLEHSEERNRALIENISDTIILVNKKLEVVYQSPAFKNTAGFAMEELKGKTALDFIHPNDRPHFDTLFKNAFDHPGQPFQNQYRILHRSGNYIWVEGTIMNLLDNESVQAFIINYRDVTERKNAEKEKMDFVEKLMESEIQIRNFARHLNSTIEEERARIAREMHDEFGQQLAGIKIGLSAFRKTKDKTTLDLANDLVKEIDNSIQTMRKIATALRPGILDSLGLIPSLKWLTQEFEKRSGIKCEFKTNTEKEKFELTISTCFFRICQEAFTNISKHAHASKVMVQVNYNGDELVLTISDNGKGISSEKLQNPFSMGLLGMRERANIIDADLDIMSKKNEGTVIQLISKIPQL